MPSTAATEADNYRQEVQTRVQDLLAGRRTRHPVISQYSTRRLMFEAVLEEIKIYRWRKEQEVFKPREETAGSTAMPERNLSHRARADGGINSDPRKHGSRNRSPASNNAYHASASDHLSDLRPTVENTRAVGVEIPLPLRIPIRARHDAQASQVSEHKVPYSGSDANPRKIDRNGRVLVRSKRGWRDASPGPFPEYAFQKGPLLGLGQLLQDRFKWGVLNYELEQKRKERRARGTLVERREVKKAKKKLERDANAEAEDERASRLQMKSSTERGEDRRHRSCSEVDNHKHSFGQPRAAPKGSVRSEREQSLDTRPRSRVNKSHEGSLEISD